MDKPLLSVDNVSLRYNNRDQRDNNVPCIHQLKDSPMMRLFRYHTLLAFTGTLWWPGEPGRKKVVMCNNAMFRNYVNKQCSYGYGYHRAPDIIRGHVSPGEGIVGSQIFRLDLWGWICSDMVPYGNISDHPGIAQLYYALDNPPVSYGRGPKSHIRWDDETGRAITLEAAINRQFSSDDKEMQRSERRAAKELRAYADGLKDGAECVAARAEKIMT